jgi:O-acetyl-ADP-ribose deacetylase (regulator of RNase III)
MYITNGSKNIKINYRRYVMDEEILKKIEIRQGDITELQVDVIVNAANSSLLGGGGVDGAIHRAAGPGLLEECRMIGGGCPTGEARITYGHKLFARYVIHTVGPVYSGTFKDRHLLELCYLNSLEIAVRHKVKSIAFPAISCGIYGYPIKDACKIAIYTTCCFLYEFDSINSVIFILFSDEDKKVYEEAINGYKI